MTKRAVASVHELHAPASKAARHAKIVAILAEQQVRSQAELAGALERAGVRVTQATLSRDLDELGAVKLRTPDGGLPVYVVPEDGSPITARTADDEPPHRLARLLGELLVSWQAIDYADGLVRVGVQSSIPHPETSALLRRMMRERGMAVPPEGRTLASICVTDLCR